MEKRRRLRIVTLSYACSTIAVTVPANQGLGYKGGATLELTNVRKEDCGLQLQCQIFPKLKGRMASERTAQSLQIIKSLLCCQKISLLAYFTDRG